MAEYLSTVYRWRVPVAALALAGALFAGVRALLQAPTYEAAVQLVFDRTAPQVLDFRDVVPMDARGDDYFQTQFRVLRSRTLAERVVERMGLADDPDFAGSGRAGGVSPRERAVRSFLSRLRVQRLTQSQIVTVSMEAARPERAAQAANTLAELFIEAGVEAQRSTVSAAASWLGEQIADQRRKVQEAEVELQALQEREGIVNVEERRVLVELGIRQLGTRFNEARTRRLEKETAFQQLSAAAHPEDLPAAGGKVMEDLRLEQAHLERKQADLQARYLDQHPLLVGVRAEIAQVKDKLAAEGRRVVRGADNEYRRSLAEENDVARELEVVKAEAVDLARRTGRYEALKRDVESRRTLLNGLMTRSKQTDVAQELRTSNIRIVDRAAPPLAPVRPRPLLDATLGLLLGLGAGVGTALLLEAFNRTVRTPRDVGVRLKALLLAVVPETRGQPEGLVLLDPGRPGPFAEGYRVLRAGLEHGPGPPGGCRVVSVVSTAHQEGKTLTAVNLALTLAARGEDVLLVDGDLRRPRADQFLGARRVPGLGEVLAGGAALAETWQPIGATRLRLLAAGGAPGPADLLGPAAAARLLAAARQSFRWVVVDTPPIGAVPDALSFAAASDAVVVVVGAEMTHHTAVTLTLERLQQAGAPVSGVVLNRARVERHPLDYGAGFGHYSGLYGAGEASDSPPRTLAEAS